MLMHNCVWEWGTEEGQGEMVPALGVHVCTSTDTKCLVPPICFPLSQGAGEELQLPWVSVSEA